MSTPAAARIAYDRFAAALRPLIRMHTAIDEAGLDQHVVELVRIRASQLNGCAYCLQMHTTDARAAGESDERLHLLAAWREASVFDARERAALAMTEAVTTLAGGVPDDVLDACDAVFSDDEVHALLFAVVEINAWNRLNVASRKPLGGPGAAA
ncbi:carboxymuconolactone decarboxylase family protein [Nitriliruptor alkaliphilus]|uniref:carboxymuconolactone decarboxylase family protein n=1 Tax=Nitriliruptor alkaliphilus TaxID=427918 RepID=UPI000B307E35|nr:carboxymuconolactone decarboxylase family protein [Nitriliruptor alkaliphilus]